MKTLLLLLAILIGVGCTSPSPDPARAAASKRQDRITEADRLTLLNRQLTAQNERLRQEAARRAK
jgi:hypothetical protein